MGLKLFFVQIIFIFFSLLSWTSSSLISYQYRNYTWVLTPSSMNHFNACQHLKLLPTLPHENIAWSYEIMSGVVNGLQLSLVNNSYGLAGCCVSGLWCSDTECYTQSLQSNFVNFYATHAIDLYTVYTCTQNTLPSTSSIETVLLQNGKVVVSGENFGSVESNIVSVMGTSLLTNIESCNTVCQSCETSPCAKDNACVLVGSSYSCLMFCSGPDDISCPCGTICQHVNVYTSQSSYVSTHFCAPKGLECDSYQASKLNQFQGRTPRIFNWVNDTGVPSQKVNIFDVTVSTSHANTGDLPVEISMQSCTTSQQCGDDSPFTSEICHLGECSSKQLTQSLGTTLPAIRERSTPFSYLMFASEGMATDQNLFESRVRLGGQYLKSLSNADDLPQEYLSIGLMFSYFGNQVSNIAINANGLVSFPPYPTCQALAGTLYCPVYGTGTNTIAIWGSDWDLRVGGDSSTVHILNQTFNSEEFDDIYGINANAFHILYSTIHKYEQGSSRSSPAEPSTFSLSLYEDNSIRIRYHTILSQRNPTDVFGAWGSRASNSHWEGLKYHEELIDTQYVHSGNDITLCEISTTACSDHAVATAGRHVNMTILGSVPSCLALGENLVMACVWLGQGSDYESTPTFYEIRTALGRDVILSCPVPNFKLPDDSLIALDLRYATTKSSLVSSLSDGKKSLLTKFSDPVSGEISTSHVMFRYFNSPNSVQVYGCNPLLPGSSNTCDPCGVCGGNKTTVDCNGDCFGSAYIDNCGVCAGGSTGIYPDSTCDLSDPMNNWNNNDVLDTLSKTILLLTMMICMTFIFSACMRILRASFVGSEEDRQDGFFGLALPHPPNRRELGLNTFEIDSLGQIKFIKDPKDVTNATNGDDLSSSHDHHLQDQDDIESSPSSCVLTLPLQPNLECSICLIEFVENDRCRQLPCDHIFHTQCIDQWFTVSVVCPMCKRNIRAILHGDDDILNSRQSQSQSPISPQLSHSPPQPLPSTQTDYLTASMSPTGMAQTIEMTDFSTNSSSSSSSSSSNARRSQAEQEAESTALINPFT